MKILAVFGTRPEAIKMAPVIVALKEQGGHDVKVCVTGQHRSMLDQVLSLFKIQPDYDLQLMQAGQSLSHITAATLQGLEPILLNEKPDRLLVHGDTTTTLAASLAAFYQKIPVAHIEAGLRSFDMHSPFPEEMNRKVTSTLADMHFAPTELAKENLMKEGVDAHKIYVTGNTVVDALLAMRTLIENTPHLHAELDNQFSYLDRTKKIILVTGHRRENFGKGLLEICKALNQIASQDDVQIVYPVHLNPNVQTVVKKELCDTKNIFLLEPQNYLSFVYLLKQSYLVLTDSGGIQEEAPIFGKPVLIMRETTERPEAVSSGSSKLVGTNSTNIVCEALKFMNDKVFYDKHSVANHVYGDGQASARIAHVLEENTALKI